MKFYFKSCTGNGYILNEVKHKASFKFCSSEKYERNATLKKINSTQCKLLKVKVYKINENLRIKKRNVELTHI